MRFRPRIRVATICLRSTRSTARRISISTAWWARFSRCCELPLSLKATSTGVIDAAFLRPGYEQVAAGYAVYGPSTMLVISVGNGTHGFTLDREVGNFVLTHSDIRIPEDTSEFAINASNERFWELPVRRYVQEWQGRVAAAAGRTGFQHALDRFDGRRGPPNPDAWRGVHVLRATSRHAGDAGALATSVRSQSDEFPDRAGGRHVDHRARARFSTCSCRARHERVPVILGSKNEVERIARYHADHDRGEDKPYTSPLFSLPVAVPA